MNLLFETNNYQDFLIELSSFVSVDSRILDNLIKLKLIHAIFENQNHIHISKNLFSFNYCISLKENYKNIPEYIFASYPLHNPDFNVLPFDENIHIYKYQLISNNSEQPIILYFNKNHNSFYIDINFDINFQLFTDHDLKLLLDNEISYLKNYIIWELRSDELNYSIYSINLHSQIHLFLNIMCVEFKNLDNNHYDLFDLYIKESRSKYYQIITDIKNLKKEEIDKIFEPALLRKELDTF